MQKILFHSPLSRTTVCRLSILMISMAALCTFEAFVSAIPATASAPDNITVPDDITMTDELLPLSARAMDAPRQSVGLDQVSDTLNDQIESDQQANTKDSLPLDSLPIIGELMDESGNFDIGIDLPFDVSINDVMGETGLIFSTDFTVD